VVETAGENQLTVAPLQSAEFFRLAGGFGEATVVGDPVSNPSVRERGPSLSEDGLTLYFFSDLPAPHADIMLTTRASLTSPWEPPIRLDAINTPTTEAWPSISADGLALFFSDRFLGGPLRPGGFGDGDLWISTRQSLQSPWQTPVNLGVNVNTAFGETTPSISRDGRTLVFASTRPGNVPNSIGGTLDLWITTRSDISDFSNWTSPTNLGSTVNSIYNDLTPTLAKDGLVLYFMSNRPSPWRPFGSGNFDVWVARRKSLSAPFGAPETLGPHFSEFDALMDPHVAADGSMLFFTSRGRVSALADLPDIWQVPLLSVQPPPLSISLSKPLVQP
jgi:Tol biopolymer transport system component